MNAMESHANRIELARWMEAESYFVCVSDAVDFFAKPSGFEREWLLYQLWSQCKTANCQEGIELIDNAMSDPDADGSCFDLYGWTIMGSDDCWEFLPSEDDRAFGTVSTFAEAVSSVVAVLESEGVSTS